MNWKAFGAAFEKMRGQLQRSHQELWRQGEERRRLNAAFSHDLRNPVTVLKGSIRVMEKVLQGDRLERAALEDHLARMSHYTERIASYIETMSQVQKLEDTPLSPVEITFGELGKEMQEEGELLLWETACPLSFQFFGSEHAVVWVDRAGGFHHFGKLFDQRQPVCQADHSGDGVCARGTADTVCSGGWPRLLPQYAAKWNGTFCSRGENSI